MKPSTAEARSPSKPTHRAKPIAPPFCEWRSSVIDYSANSGVALITVNRPEKRNALTSHMLVSLRGALDRAANDPDVRVLLVRGAGADFCAGLDLQEVLQTSDESSALASARRLGDLYIAMRRHPKPIVAAVQGR